jgi:hypothetical protein
MCFHFLNHLKNRTTISNDKQYMPSPTAVNRPITTRNIPA